MTQDDQLTAKQVARRFGVTVKQVYEWAKNGKLAFQPKDSGKGYLFSHIYIEEKLKEYRELR